MSRSSVGETRRWPRAIEELNGVDKLEARLAHSTIRIEGYSFPLPVQDITDTIGKVLIDSSRFKKMVRGLEAIEKNLDNEARGIAKVGAETKRITRVLFLSNDRTPRFERNVAAMLKKHGQSLLVICTNLNSEELAKYELSARSPCKALMVTRKDLVVRLLMAIMD